MKFREEFAFLICSLSAILLVAEGQAGKKTRVDDYSYSYEYESDYDNARPPPVKPVDNRIACYSCDYEEIDGQPSTVGHCNEPFNGFGVPETMCNGSCFMSHIWLKKPTDFMLIRGCRPLCTELVREDRYTRCCSTKLCNGFTSSIQQVKFNVCLTLLLAFVALFDFTEFS